ncbi:serine/threonine-protein kinase [Reyranella soli]|uniref:Protein kinase n=1 Tax=Reyranella soli TaxID=1230389 RepID=A0A512NFX7_9HYPH|nr:serine/threonine-protein kinase [Reyranella soli]GEP57847.1 protein kinase [Reyranella soli]
MARSTKARFVLPTRYKPEGAGSSGGFGHVTFCRDLHLDRLVAIKFIQDPAESRRLKDEFQALLTLRSKHVVQVYDLVPGPEDTVGIVEEFIPGKDLFESDIPSSLNEYLRAIWQIASGIADIHEAKIIHRDIKPNNMKFDGEGIIKIFDFGLARAEGAEAVTKNFVGTRGFAAPELYGTNTVPFSRAVDTYAFGATALYLATRNLPKNILQQPPSALADGTFRGLNLGLRSSLADLLQATMEHDPAQRPLMSTIRDKIARQLLRGKHQALTVLNGKASYLNARNRVVKLELPSVGKIEISYDMYRFKVTAVSGEVAINNKPVVVGQEIPGSCVVALGGGHRQWFQRAYVTFDVSHPEVVL